MEEHGVYTLGKGRKRLLLGMYVDDLILTGTDLGEIKSFKEEMKRSLKMSDIGCLSYYLGIEVKQERGRITMNQVAYTTTILDKAGMSSCNSVEVPLETCPKLSKKSANISFAVCEPVHGESYDGDMSVVKHLLHYIAGMLHFDLNHTKGTGDLKLQGYSDADIAGDVDDRKSTTGILFYLGRAPVT
ncbi:uncharacterized mitochondrial protein AtMg00810-like [Phragmites australis]|uniref:uncharacterized mitochondrial protein AtMg00810-like n=1 Tax=Phragmites australis TaxID=29695 RepID=UPI002D78B3E9|nr:uncharacterized mitochondrial protein AtMg00810-like [Phragmites australis]